ncbi:MAG: hypothetical protein JJ863_18650 [Deltaproteobacteria bacterium]|nr:hypothetical protein [Deltaproteobacteria bacterium]
MIGRVVPVGLPSETPPLYNIVRTTRGQHADDEWLLMEGGPGRWTSVGAAEVLVAAAAAAGSDLVVQLSRVFDESSRHWVALVEGLRRAVGDGFFREGEHPNPGSGPVASYPGKEPSWDADDTVRQLVAFMPALECEDAASRELVLQARREIALPFAER